MTCHKAHHPRIMAGGSLWRCFGTLDTCCVPQRQVTHHQDLTPLASYQIQIPTIYLEPTGFSCMLLCLETVNFLTAKDFCWSVWNGRLHFTKCNHVQCHNSASTLVLDFSIALSLYKHDSIWLVEWNRVTEHKTIIYFGTGIPYGSQGVTSLPFRASFPPHFSKIVGEALVSRPLMFENRGWG